MPKNLKLPYPPLVTLDVTQPLEWLQLEEKYGARLAVGLSILIRPYGGPELRGGYFFHLRREGTQILFFAFDGQHQVAAESGVAAAALMNHVAGLAYSEECWKRLQIANLREDD
jgi:hypothetical protein